MGQLAQFFNSQQIETIALWDNLVPQDVGDYWKVAQQIQHVVNITYYPSAYTRDHMPLKPVRSIIIGHPSIQTFSKELEGINAQDVLAKIPTQILEGKKHFVGFIAGWPGDEDAKKECYFFKECLSQMKREDILVIVTCHPRGDKTFEKGLYSDFPFVFVPDNISTNEMTVISELIINQKSTAGPKIATFKNIMFAVSDHSYTNPLIESKMYSTVRKAELFPESLEETLGMEQKPDVFEILQMPKDPIGFIKQLIRA
ncbi:hypothetical protein FGO68_gene8656 [Halteria grandinella]|uniref:Uncharacterized protein n=1 Tax=Halteria grandinella TaxID=5974 RepID=A0A8J8T097_HALGN|nr:hypothetical protein FGO68_gene8656 [Halteria grandinella]